MPLPVAHALLGATTTIAIGRGDGGAKSARRALLSGALLGICPDFDYLLNLLAPYRGDWHHGFTHSLAFAGAIGLLVYLAKREDRRRSAMIYGAAVLSHPLLDYLFTESRGVELFWPIWRERIRLNLPSPLFYSWRTTSLAEGAWDLLKLSLAELLLCLPVFAAALVIKGRWRTRREGLVARRANRL